MLGGLFIDCAGNCGTSSVITGKEWLGDRGVCSGDSGGPALDIEGRVIGVVSRGGNWGDICATPVYGSVFGWADWIKEQAAIAATHGGYEPAAWVTGGSTLPETDAGAWLPEAGAEETNQDLRYLWWAVYDAIHASALLLAVVPIESIPAATETGKSARVINRNKEGEHENSMCPLWN